MGITKNDCIWSSDIDTFGLCSAGLGDCKDDCPFYNKNDLEAMNERLKIKAIKAEAYKEFAEQYKNQIKNYTGQFTDNGFMVNLEAVLRAIEFVKDKLVGEDHEKIHT